MKIGIVGKGKMGLDIFSFLQQKDCELVLICRREEDIQELTMKFEKQLQRLKRRGIISDEEYVKKAAAFLITDKYEYLRDCDLVIESVIEDIVVKKIVIAKIEENVQANCIIASNSSSLDLDRVFSVCMNMEHCVGLHFFYPVKYTEYVEINKTINTSPETVKRLIEMMKRLDKKVLLLPRKANYCLTKILTTIVAYSYHLYTEGWLPIRMIDQLIKERIMLFGPFEIVDSTGLYIIDQCTDSFLAARNYDLIKDIGTEIKLALKNGYDGNENGIIAFEEATKEAGKCWPKKDSTEYQEQYERRIWDVLQDEVNYYVEEKEVSRKELCEAITDVFGLREKRLV